MGVNDDVGGLPEAGRLTKELHFDPPVNRGMAPLTELLGDVALLFFVLKPADTPWLAMLGRAELGIDRGITSSPISSRIESSHGSVYLLQEP